jgi:glutamine synthetase
MDQKSVINFARENECVFADIKFSDFLGQWRRIGVPIQQFSTTIFEEGLSLDSSALPGWDSKGAGLVLVPDPSTMRVDPFPKAKTMSLIGSVREGANRSPFPLDPRNIAKKAVEFMAAEGIGETASFGVEPGFFIFDDVRFDQTRNSAFHFVDSVEAQWNSGREEGPNLGYKGKAGESRYPVQPYDSLADLRQEMAQELIRLCIGVEREQHEAASAGQCELVLRHTNLVEEADNLQWVKYVLRNTALRSAKTLTFMPKPVFEEPGSSMHVSQSLWRSGKNLFSGEEYGGLSRTALHYVGGILRHAPALLALCNPTANSFRRLLAKGEVPTALSYSSVDKNAVVRTPLHPAGAKARRIEFCLPDPSANGYLAFAALLMAGLDGIIHRIEPGAPLEEKPKTKAGWMPRSLEEALRALEKDHSFLLAGGVFSKKAVESLIELKLEREVRPLALRTTPYEFSLYYDC